LVDLFELNLESTLQYYSSYTGFYTVSRGFPVTYRLAIFRRVRIIAKNDY